MESTSAWRTHKGAWAFPMHHCFFLQVNGLNKHPQWEEERRAPVRAHGAEDGGGAPGPSTVKGERRGEKFLKQIFFLAVAKAMRRKPHHLALAEAPILFFSVVLCWQNVKICECSAWNAQFSMHRGRQCATPNDYRTLGRVARRKGASPGLGGGADPFFLCRIVLAKR